MLTYLIVYQFIVVAISALSIKIVSDENVKYMIASLTSIVAIYSIIIACNQCLIPENNVVNIINILKFKQYKISIDIMSDSLSVITSSVACIISALLSFFAIGYIQKSINFFLLYLNLFLLMFMFFIASDNVMQMYMFLEFLTISAYFLICFDSRKHQSFAGLKMIAQHKISSASFLIASIIIYNVFQSFEFDSIGSQAIIQQTNISQIEIINALVFVAIAIKSAQFGAGSWLKNVSEFANILSVCMICTLLVPSGIFIIIRLQTLFECSDFILNIIIVYSIISAISAMRCALIATQIHYIMALIASTFTSLMLIACCFSSYGSAIALYVTFAFSSVLLFLSTGSVIYAMSGEYNILNMGGLLEKLPKTFYSFLIATATIAGIPLLSSYYSRKIFINDIIFSDLSISTFTIICVMLIFFTIAVVLTQLINKIFNGTLNCDAIGSGYINEDNALITRPIYISVLFSIFSGMIFYYGYYYETTWKDILIFTEHDDSHYFAILQAIYLISLIFAFILRNTSFHSLNYLNYINLEKAQTTLDRCVTIYNQTGNDIFDKFIKLLNTALKHASLQERRLFIKHVDIKIFWSFILVFFAAAILMVKQ